MCRPLTWIEKKSGPESPRQHSCQRNASPKSNRRNARVFTVKKLRLRIIYYLHGGKKICINVVELAQCDDDWQRNRTHRRGMRDYWEAALCFGKYWCFSSGRNKFELCDRRGNRCAHLSVSHWLQKPQSACAQLLTPALQNNRMMTLGSTLSALAAETATMSAVSSNDHKYIYLHVADRR